MFFKIKKILAFVIVLFCVLLFYASQDELTVCANSIPKTEEPIGNNVSDSSRSIITEGFEVTIGTTSTLCSTFEEAWNLVQSDGVTHATFKMYSDYDLTNLQMYSSRLNVSGFELDFDLNGCRIIGKQASTIFYINDKNGQDGKLNLLDSSQDKTGEITGSGRAIYITGGGEAVMNGGTISGIHISREGIVYVDKDCKFSMLSGSIKNNSTSYGAVYLYFTTSEFYMHGGEISDNLSSSPGAGVYSYQAHINVSGTAKIMNNKHVDSTDNTEKASNIQLINSADIYVDGTLEDGAQIGVTPYSYQIGYIKNYEKHNPGVEPSSYFIADRIDQCVGLQSDGQAYVYNHKAASSWKLDVEGGKHYHECQNNCKVKIDEEAHSYELNGVCSSCGTQAAAMVTSIGFTFYSTFEEAWNAALESGTAIVKMLKDATIYSTLEVENGKNIALDLDGNMLSFAENSSGSVIDVKGAFTLSDGYSETDKKHTINGQTITGGVITGGNSKNHGGGVYVSGGTFYMNGGSIAGNKAVYGGGVSVNTGTFYMSGSSKIICNEAKNYGGGVYVGVGTFEMTGGSIGSENTLDKNTSDSGGGVYVYVGKFKVLGNVTIIGNIGASIKTSNNFSGHSDALITVAGALTKETKIGITKKGAFATGFTSEMGDPADFFIPDDSSKNCVYLDADDLLKTGVHTGGTVACEAKAKCDNCKKEYGSLRLHSYTTTYEWSNDFSTCEAKRVCKYTDCNKEEKELATTSLQNVDQSCIEGKHTIYTAVFKNNAFEKQIKRVYDENLPALGHNWEQHFCTLCGIKEQIYWGIENDKLIISNMESDISSIDIRKGNFDYDDATFDFPYNQWLQYREIITSAEVKGNVSPTSTVGWFLYLGVQSIDLSGLNTSNVTNMKGMFYGCRELTDIKFPATFDTSNVTDMSDMFSSCNSLTTLDLSIFNTEKVTDMSYMFGDSAFKSLDLITFNTSHLTTMNHMFWNCKDLISVNLSSFNTSIVKDMSDVFSGCEKLETIVTPNVLGIVSADLPGLYWNGSTDVTKMEEAKKTLTRHDSHTYKMITTKNATCEDMGEQKEMCTVCNTEKVNGATQTIPALGHNYGEPVWEWSNDGKMASAKFTCANDNTHEYCESATITSTIKIAATCTEKGTTTYNATVILKETKYSSTKDVLDIELLEHSYGNWQTTIVPTCSAKGNKKHVCTVCEFEENEAIDIDTTAHSWNEGEVTTEPTCISKGIKTFTCQHNSNHTRTEDIEIETTAHSWNEGEVTTEPTCISKGVKTYTCQHNSNHTRTEDIEIDTAAHSWNEGEVTTEPTCISKGVKTYTCLHNSNHIKTEDIELLEHSYGNWQTTIVPTCSAKGNKKHVCTVCEFEENEAIDIDTTAHSWNEGEVTTEPTCISKGIKTFTCQHNSNHTRTEEIEIETTAHSWNEGEVTTEPTCISKGIKTFTCQHNSNHTRTEDIEIETTAHSWNEGEVTAESTCISKGVKTYTCQHNSNHTRTEDIEIDTAAHSWNEGEVTTEPTCISKGVKTYTCLHNSNHIKTEDIELLEHSYGNWQTTIVPTCSAKGNKKHVCTVCEFEENEAIDIDTTAHSFGEWEISKTPSCTEKGEETRSCLHHPIIKETRLLDALGHNFANEFTVDKQPTISEEGSKSKHCMQCGAKKEITAIEKLIEQLVKPGNDGENQIVVTTPNGFTHDIELVVTEIDHEEYDNYEVIANSVDGKINLIYDVTLKSNGVEIQPDGTLTIKLLIPEQLLGKTFKLFHLHENEAIDMDYTIDEKYAVISIDKLSEFIFVGEKMATTKNFNPLWMILLIFESLIIVGEIGYIINRKTRKSSAKEKK